MHLSKLLLQNFRSYKEKLFEFDQGLNLILGPNGSGKTNILESIYFLTAGKSFRSSSMSKLILWNQRFSSVKAKIAKSSEEVEIGVRLIYEPEKSASVKRQFFLRQVEKPRKAYMGVLKTVIFHPEDIRLVNGSPSRRREFLDEIFQSIEWRYASALTQYKKALKHRNELLDLIRLGKSTKSELFYWDQSLTKNAAIVQDYRFNFFKSANLYFSSHSNPEIQSIFLNYRPSVVSQARLDQNYEYDLRRGHTSCGIHLDDFSFDSSIFPQNDKNLAFWGSRGQQRLAVLALRLAQIHFFEQIYHDAPILLLDDIFSELDSGHQKLVVDVCRQYQTIFSSSENNSSLLLPDAKIIKID